jgi:phosphoribosylamine-glycine ligase
MYILAINIPYSASNKEFATYEEAMEYVKKEQIDSVVKEWATFGYDTSWYIAKVKTGKKY